MNDNDNNNGFEPMNDYNSGYGSDNANQSQGYGQQGYAQNQGYNQQSYNQGYGQNYQYGQYGGQYGNGYGMSDTSVMSVKDWIVTFLLMCIPIANFVLMFVWAFGNGNQNRKNWAKAALILTLISIVLWIVLGGLIGGMLLTSVSDQYY